MSLFCESSSQLPLKQHSSLEQFSLKIIAKIIQSKNGLRVDNNQFALKLNEHQDKVIEGITTWTCSSSTPELSIRVTLQLKSIRKAIQKRLADTLNKQFKFSKITYLKPKLSSTHKIRLNNQPNSKSLEQEITAIVSYITQIVSRIKQLQKQHSKLQPYIELYMMRQCFQFIRSSRPKSTKISLKAKKNKVVTDVMKLLAKGEATLNSLEGLFVDGEIRKYEELKGKVLTTLEQMARNGDHAFEQSILTSIDIMKIEDEQALNFPNQQFEDQLSVLTRALYTFRKEITIHKENKMRSLSNEVFQECLVKKSKCARGADQFDNETKLLTFLKGSYHPHIAEYYCKLEDTPFKSEAIYVHHYEGSLGAMRSVLSMDKRLEVAHQIAKVLSYLFYRKLCHRDLKLDNIMLDKKLSPRVIDWGSACQMYSLDKDAGGLKVKNEALYSTEGYFQRYFQDVHYEPFGKHYTKEQIQRGQFFDVYSFGFILQKMFCVGEMEDLSWVEYEIDFVSKKCREKNPADRLSAIELEIYLGLLVRKWKKIQKSGLSSPMSSAD